MTIAEMDPTQLLALVITGTMVGVYAPALLYRHIRDNWHRDVVARAYACFLVIGFVAITVLPTLLLLRSAAVDPGVPAPTQVLDNAREAIGRGVSRDAIVERLLEHGYSDEGL